MSKTIRLLIEGGLLLAEAKNILRARRFGAEDARAKQFC
jgi:hypothetical protein